MNPETKIEERMFRRIKRSGGFCIKMTPTVAGIPDRLVLLPGGRVYLVELKTTTGRLRPIQRVWHDRAVSRVQAPVITLYGQDQVDSWLDEVLGSPGSGVSSASEDLPGMLGP